MFNEIDLLNRLRSGEKAEDIANEFAEVINAAHRKYEEEQSNRNKLHEMDKILDDAEAWVKRYYPDKLNMEKVTSEMVIELIDSLIEYTDLLKGLEAEIKELYSNSKDNEDKFPCEKPAVSVEEKIKAWLNSIGW